MTTGYVFPLSAAQQRLWFLQQIEPASTAYHLAGAVELQGSLSVEALGRSLNALAERHEALRTAFFDRAGTPGQVVLEAVDVPLPVTGLEGPESEARETLRRLLAAELGRPFDLTHAPCFRARLFRLAPERHVLGVAVHHLVADGWSLGVLVRELGTCYSAFAHGEVPHLAPLEIQYGDFAVWQQELLAADGQEEHLQYWARRLAGPVPPLDLPTDHLRPTIERHHGDRLTFTLEAPLAEAIGRLAREEAVTPFMVALAAFQVLLARYSGQTDFGIGSPVAGRGRPELEGLVGFFVNTVVLRADLSGNPTFRDLLGRVRTTTLEAFEHQDVPFERLVDALRVPRDPGRNPLFQVMLAFQPPDLALPALCGLEVRPVEFERRAAQFDLTLFLHEEGARLAGWVDFSTDLFERATIERLVGHFRQVLAAAIAQPDTQVDAIDLLSEAERDELKTCNATAASFPASCVHKLVEAQAGRTPAAVAVTDALGSLTYEGLNGRANQIARRLRDLGVGRGDRVGVCVERSAGMVAAVLGVVKAGAAYVPLDSAYPPDRLAFMLSDAEVGVLVVDATTRNTLDVGSIAVLDLDRDGPAVAAEPATNLSIPARPEDLAYTIYTSGSTGRPKGVEVQHRALVNLVTSIAREPGLTADDVLVAVTTLSFDIAALELWLPLVVGAKVVVASRETAVDGLALARLLESAGATVLQATPATWRLLLEAGWWGKRDLRILCGGEALSRDLADRLLESGAEVWNLYGPTETTIWSSLWRVQEGGPALIGHPIANTSLHVLDEHRQPVPVGVVGELYIGGAGVARGYRKRPDLTAERFVPDPFSGEPGARMYRTGDLARRRPDGALECLGRLDHQVKIRGYRIELGEIEQVLRGHGGVTDAVVMAVEARPGNRRLVAYVVTGAADWDALRAHAARHLPDYMVPAHYVALEALPRTPNGKVDRKALPAPNLSKRPAEYEQPRGPVEAQVAAIWAEVLGLERVGRTDNFFELGGHSLLATRVAARVEQSLGVHVPLAAFFRAPTVGRLAGLIEGVVRPVESVDGFENFTL